MSRRIQGQGTSAFKRRPPYTGSRRFRRPYVPSYGVTFPYGLSAAPYFLAYPDNVDDDVASAPPDSHVAENDGAPLDPASDSYGPAAAGIGEQRAAITPGISVAENAVTLIFKDGRPPELIHNYILTRDTLFVGGRHPEIPVDQLDLIATAKVNHEAGIDFRLPDARR